MTASAEHLRGILCRMCEGAWRDPGNARLSNEDCPITLRAITAVSITDALKRLMRHEQRLAKTSAPENCYIPLIVHQERVPHTTDLPPTPPWEIKP